MSTRKVITEDFGKLKDGTPIKRFTLSNVYGVTIRVINYGAIITDVLVPDKYGNVEDISLGFDDLEGYEKQHNPYPYFGAVCGRVVNRIANGKFILDGQEYTLAVNNGPNHLHGGLKGFNRAVWNANVIDNKVKLKYTSPDGEENYPGELTTIITYELTNENELIIDYTATTTKATPINLTNHVYFNLGGQGSFNIDDHVVTIEADKYTPFNENSIPTGDIVSVESTPYDLRTPVRIGDRLNDVNKGRGFGINYCIGETGKMKECARVEHPPSGRIVKVSTTEPGLQFYTAYYLNNIQGKGGSIYGRFGGFCLETQHYPDSVNHDNFPRTILRPGQTYRHTCIYSFGISGT